MLCSGRLCPALAACARVSARSSGFKNLKSAHRYQPISSQMSTVGGARKYSPLIERNIGKRRVLSSSPKINEVPMMRTRPPFLVRVGIIGSSITLATPLFAVAGVFRIWSSVLPKTAEGLIAKKVISLLIGGGSVTLVWFYFLPFLRDYPDLIFPFALSNGAMCMLWHAAAEATLGLERLAGQASQLGLKLPTGELPKFWQRLPLGGAALGALTALTAPMLWGLATDVCWSPELKELLLGKRGISWVLDTYYGVGMTVALPVGVLSGISLHYLLKPFIMGISTPSRMVPWYASSLPFLAVTATACALYYGTSRLRGVGVTVEDFMWMPRMDPKTGAAISVNVRTGEAKREHDTADLAASKIYLIQWLHYLRDPLQELRALFTDKPTQESLKLCHDESLMEPSGPLQPSVITADNFGDYSDLYLLVDLLVRYAHIKDTAGLNSSQMEKLREQAKEAFGIRNLQKLFQLAEVGCVAQRRLVRGAADSLVGDSVEKSQLRPLMLELQGQFKGENILEQQFGKSKEKGAKVVRLLSANLATLEKELDEKIGYQIALGDDGLKKEAELIQAFKSDALWDYYSSTSFIFKSTFAVAAVAAASVALKTVLDKK